MKVLNIYSKKDLDVLTYNGDAISKIMDDFFSKFPVSYRENYDKNLESLEIWKVDEEANDIFGGYSEVNNIVLIRKFSSFIHELMHVASTNRETGMTAFMRVKGDDAFEGALIEGFTEYLASCVALSVDPKNYYFETFVVSMLSDIEGIFEPYFIPSYNNFISLFPNKRDIISLMYALEYYANFAPEYALGEISFNSDKVGIKVGHSIKDVIDNLIDIQLSFKRSKRENKLYSEKFMDLLSDDLFDFLDLYDVDYLNYANKQLNKRVLRRSRWVS